MREAHLSALYTRQVETRRSLTNPAFQRRSQSGAQFQLLLLDW